MIGLSLFRILLRLREVYMGSFLVENESSFKKFYSTVVVSGVSSYDYVFNLLNSKSIDTFNRVVYFFAQCSHESSGFTCMSENLNYSANGLLKHFPKYFKTLDFAEAYASKKDRDVYIANRVYANRMGNGDELSGDGYRYRGRGYIQLTGKDNYTRFAKYMGMGLDEVVKHLETVEGAFDSAVWYWSVNRLNHFCDAEDFKGLTKAINGGYNGLEDRIRILNRYIDLFNSILG